MAMTQAAKRGLDIVLRWQTEAPPGLTLAQWIAAGQPKKAKP